MPATWHGRCLGGAMTDDTRKLLELVEQGTPGPWKTELHGTLNAWTSWKVLAPDGRASAVWVEHEDDMRVVVAAVNLLPYYLARDACPRCRGTGMAPSSYGAVFCECQIALDAAKEREAK